MKTETHEEANVEVVKNKETEKADDWWMQDNEDNVKWRKWKERWKKVIILTKERNDENREDIKRCNRN